MAHVHVVEDPGEADVTVAQVERDQADLLVFRVHDKYDAPDDQVWWYAPEPWDATRIAWVDDAASADLTICFVDAKYDAMWTRSHVLQNRLMQSRWNTPPVPPRD